MKTVASTFTSYRSPDQSPLSIGRESDQPKVDPQKTPGHTTEPDAANRLDAAVASESR